MVLKKGQLNSLVILTSSRLNEDGAYLVIPDREVTLTLEAGLGSKREDCWQ